MSKPNTPLPKFTPDEISDHTLGMCIECHDTQEGCKPDARNYECESCGARAVFGLEELIVMGYDILADDDDDDEPTTSLDPTELDDDSDPFLDLSEGNHANDHGESPRTNEGPF